MLYHIADVSAWSEATRTGSYAVSTRGLMLDQVGFIHLCTAEQLEGVADRFYRGVDGLVLLHIDERRCSDPIRFEPVGDTDERFPHLYGPLPVAAVVRVEPFTAPPATSEPDTTS